LHALPVRYNPAQNAVLRTSPAQVQITFSEQLNPDISKIVVVNPSNQEVDNHDSQISGDALTMTVTLPLLPAGTYVVFWRTHSAEDGHVVGGSYLFHVARADGTVPPLSGPLPSGSIIGGAGLANTGSLDGPNLLGALARWSALLGLTFLLGLLFWVYVVQPRQPYLTEAFRADFSVRLRRGMLLALAVILIATCVEVAAQAWLLNGSLQGVLSPTLLSGILVQSRFGRAILIRALFAFYGLVALVLRKRPLGDKLLQGVIAVIFGIGMALAFEYSGHGGAAPQWWGPIIDFLHLLANSVWLGGLFVIALVIVPLLLQRGRDEREAYLAQSVPAFSVPALIAVGFLIITGPLNATVRLTSVQQLWTTPYGIVLDLKSLLFLIMVAISYHHAFRLRPALVAELGISGTDARPTAWYSELPIIGHLAHLMATPQTPSDVRGIVAPGVPAGGVVAVPGRRGRFQSNGKADQLLYWMRVEAIVGVSVLLCAALLAPLAGTLAPGPASASGSFGASGGTQTLTQKADNLTVTLSVNPGKFGTNTFTLVVKNPDGSAASNGTVFLELNMVEMDMGTNEVDLKPTTAPGTYTGQGAIAMAGHWTIQAVIRTKEDPGHLHRTTFTISASY
jgi:putative copper export protein/methionine-rich copper-binding protein CopC